MTSPLGLFLSGGPARANAVADPWGLIGRALAGANRPARPRLAEARAVAARGSLPWRDLVEAGLVPPGWASDPSRGFVSTYGTVRGVFTARDGDGWWTVDDGGRSKAVHRDNVAPGVDVGDLASSVGWRYGRAVLDAPDGHEIAVALAADLEGAAAAEVFAREAASRLAFWGAEPEPRPAWQILRPWESFAPTLSQGAVERVEEVLRDETPLLMDAEAAAFRRILALTSANNGPHVGPIYSLSLASLRWEALAGMNRRAPRGARPFYRDLGNPFTPLLEVAALGYSAGSPEGRTLRIFAPRLGLEGGA